MRRSLFPLTVAVLASAMILHTLDRVAVGVTSDPAERNMPSGD